MRPVRIQSYEQNYGTKTNHLHMRLIHCISEHTSRNNALAQTDGDITHGVK